MAGARQSSGLENKAHGSKCLNLDLEAAVPDGEGLPDRPTAQVHRLHLLDVHFLGQPDSDCASLPACSQWRRTVPGPSRLELYAVTRIPLRERSRHHGPPGWSPAPPALTDATVLAPVRAPYW